MKLREIADDIEEVLEYVRRLNFAKPKYILDSVDRTEAWLATVRDERV